MNPRPNVWTPERVAALPQLIADGLSLSQIAAQFGHGFNRNMVGGKIDRMGLADGRPLKIKVLKPADPKQRQRDTARAAGVAGRIAARQEAGRPPRRPPSPAEAPPMRREGWSFLTAFADLQRNQCRAPDPAISDPPSAYRYCGRPTADGTSYCPACSDVMFQRKY
jgi:hypothetical protein